MTIVGKINNNIGAHVDIYVKDPFCANGLWGIIPGGKSDDHPDRTSCGKRIRQSGTKEKPLVTNLSMVSVFETGETSPRPCNLRERDTSAHRT